MQGSVLKQECKGIAMKPCRGAGHAPTPTSRTHSAQWSGMRKESVAPQAMGRKQPISAATMDTQAM